VTLRQREDTVLGRRSDRFSCLQNSLWTMISTFVTKST